MEPQRHSAAAAAVEDWGVGRRGSTGDLDADEGEGVGRHLVAGGGVRGAHHDAALGCGRRAVGFEREREGGGEGDGGEKGVSAATARRQRERKPPL